MNDYGDWGGALISEGDADIVIMGAPYDAMSTNRRGAAAAPKAVREASSAQSLNPCTEEGHSLREVTRLADRGDLVLPEEHDGAEEIIYREVKNLGAIPLILGGDHSITPAAVKAISEKHGKIDILYFDAHPDLYESYRDSTRTHASTAYRLAKEIDFGRFVQVGIRMPGKGQFDLARELGIEIITVYHMINPDNLRFENPLYLSLDMDCLDPAFAPGVGNPVPGGLTSREVLDILKSISARIAGADVVECVPEYDVSQITATAAARFVIEIAGLIAGVR